MPLARGGADSDSAAAEPTSDLAGALSAGGAAEGDLGLFAMVWLSREGSKLGRMANSAYSIAQFLGEYPNDVAIYM
jgi:hypothetical protein